MDCNIRRRQATSRIGFISHYYTTTKYFAFLEGVLTTVLQNISKKNCWNGFRSIYLFHTGILEMAAATKTSIPDSKAIISYPYLTFAYLWT